MRLCLNSSEEIIKDLVLQGNRKRHFSPINRRVTWGHTGCQARRPTVHTSFHTAWLCDLGKKGKKREKKKNTFPIPASILPLMKNKWIKWFFPLCEMNVNHGITGKRQRPLLLASMAQWGGAEDPRPAGDTAEAVHWFSLSTDLQLIESFPPVRPQQQNLTLLLFVINWVKK